MQFGIKDESNLTATLYIDSSTRRDFSLSWQGVPPQNSACNIWDHVEFYVMHNFLARQLRAISNHFKPFN
jgi:hypothetical protein